MVSSALTIDVELHQVRDACLSARRGELCMCNFECNEFVLLIVDTVCCSGFK